MTPYQRKFSIIVAFTVLVAVVSVASTGKAPKVDNKDATVVETSVQASSEHSKKQPSLYDIVPYAGGYADFMAKTARPVPVVKLDRSYISAAAVEPRQGTIAKEDDGDDVEEAMENPEPDDPLIKQWAHCNGHLGCIAVAVRERDVVREPLIQQQTFLLGVDQALKQLQLFASDKKTRVRGADQAEVSGLVPKGMVRTSQLREVIQQLLKQTNEALEDKDEAP